MDDLGLPELALLLATDLAVLDHSDGTVLLIANVDWDADERWRRTPTPSPASTPMAARPGPRRPPATVARPDAASTRGRQRAPAAPTTRPPSTPAREEIRAGEAFQIVLSQRFEPADRGAPLDVYRVLRATNPSPYMYLLRFDGRGSTSSARRPRRW